MASSTTDTLYPYLNGNSHPDRSGSIVFFPSLSALFALLALLSFPSFTASSQPVLRSAIRGEVLDAQTRSPLPGANIVLIGSDPLIGATSDEDGRFRISGVPIGSRQIKVTYLGYTPFISGDLVINSGKETFVTVELHESVLTSGEVEIKGDYKKTDAINRMAMVSVRSFSVDETFRFAGSYNDPARMAANFAGVTSGVDNRNDIIVRGNSPMGLQWRLNDIEIANPNHFAAVGTTGGPVTILNNNLLTNSDFLTGAFPAQYGNALSGVFDMRMRTGNNEKREYWFGIGWNGLEFGTEGPFSKKSGASYIFSYRYSLLELLNYAGLKLGTDPHYQDMNFNVVVPVKKAGTFSICGIGGLSFIRLWDSKKSEDKWLFPGYGEDLTNGSNTGMIGVTHQIFLKPTLRMKNLVSIVGSDVFTRIDTLATPEQEPAPWAGERSKETKLSYSFELMKKFSARNTLESGLTLDQYWLNYEDSIIRHGTFEVHTGSREQMQFLRGFVQWRHQFTDMLVSTAGLYGSYLTLNNTWTAEPRLGVEWNISDAHSLDFGAGLYSQMQPRVIYFIQTELPDGSVMQTNHDLLFTKSAQAALGYNYLIGENLRLKTEVYYQYLFDIPVKASIPQYSLSNQGHEFFLDRQYSDSLVSSGTAENYGIELTFERFFKKNYYYLFTASLFNSTYEGYDQVTRNSAFNVNYVFNAVGGYEFVMGKRKWGVLSFGLRATWAGGNPYIPYDVDATVAAGEPVLDWNNAYTVRYPDYKRFSFRFGIKRNLPGYHLEFMLDLQYRTNYTNVYLQRINPATGEIRDFFEMGFFPMGTWRIQF